jgi:thiazole synthase
MNAVSDILIIGGGVIGLAIAVELKRRGATVTVLSRDFSAATAHAAAGMLAPQAEEISSSPMLELCRASRLLYPEWVYKLEQITGMTTGYWPCGILAPVYDTPALTASHRADNDNSVRQWLDSQAIHLYQPGLGADVVGGWWYPEDAQVDNRALLKALRLAAQEQGVDLTEGVSVEAIEQQNRQVVAVRTAVGEFRARHYVLATGAWSQQLLPIPVSPKKGQMLSLQMPKGDNESLPLQRILFAPETYLVPRRDGRLIVGATSEDVGWTPHNTPAGIQSLLESAGRLYPDLRHWSIQEMWWGFRPATPDELPILGQGSCENLIFATGHYRNGILLAPITATLICDLIEQQKPDPLLEHFHHSRFYKTEQGSVASNGKNPAFISRHLSSPEATPTPMPLTFSTPTFDSPTIETELTDPLIIAGRKFRSRLMTGTGKYQTLEQMQQSIAASGSQIVTVAVRRVQTKAAGHEGLAEALDWTKLWMLPNTAGCKTAEEAVRVARLGREMAKLLGQEDNNFVKLEVIPDAKYLLPDPIGTLEAAEQLVKEGFAVLPYINADPLLAKRLEELGCVTVMPLGSPIGSGQGIKNAANIEIIIEEANVPVVVDAGIGTPSEAAYSMELGADALLINSAIAMAKNPVAMGQAMGMATQAGRLAYLSGRIPIKIYATASSPLTGTVGN